MNRCKDMHGTPLSVGDAVIVVDNSFLVGDIPEQGQIVMVTKLVDANTNFIEFGDYGFLGHRTLKLITK
jgi:hypothetical protein